MKTRAWVLGWVLIAASAAPTGATEWFVATNGSDAAAGTNWASAKRTIQAGVDAAGAGDTVWVSNGTYVGLATVNKGIRLESVNGPDVTTIQGSSSRCVEMSAAAAVVAGFTLTGGTADWGGGAYIDAGTLEDCVIRNNTATGRTGYDDPDHPDRYSISAYGGGVYGGTLRDCRVVSNSASVNNVAELGIRAYGGGAYQSHLINCLVWDNAVRAYNGEVPAICGATGGGTRDGTNENCTIVGNSASASTPTGEGAAAGGGCWGSVNLNSIIWYNTAKDPETGDIEAGSSTFTCASNAPGGSGNSTNEPAFLNRFTGNWRLMTNSPCVDAGTNQPWMSGASDLGGNPRISGGRVDMGAYETQPGGTAGNWYVATNGNDAADGASWPTAKQTIQAGIDASTPGDTIWVSNGVYATGGGRAVVGNRENRVAIDQAVAVRSVNGPAETRIVGGGMRCVYVVNGAMLSGFTLTNGSTSAGPCGPGGDPCGVDQNGGGAFCEEGAMLTNCVLSGNTAANEGGGVAGGTLDNCLLTGNNAFVNGGGAAGSALSHCVLTSNSVMYTGGGAYGGALDNCLLAGNYSGNGGGGAGGATLNNCTLAGNSAYYGGGACWATLKNCVVFGNDGDENYTNYFECVFTNSCTTPDPGGTGNITNDPQFVNSGAGNFRLAVGSPCRDAGNNAYAAGTTDLDGHPRIANGTVDMGAYEVQPGGGGGAWYVATNGADAAAGTNWATAKLTIQAGVDAASDGDVVWVSNGVYDVGGRALYGGMTNRVAIDKSISVQSVNGSAATILRGGVATRCAYVGTNAVLSGFTLTNGATWNAEFAEHERGRSGGGAWAESSGVLTNCVLSGNSAESYGGGAFGGTLRNCTLKGNTASWGGGAHGATLWACEVSGNSVTIGGSGGGVNSCTANLCDISGNMADVSGGGGAFESTLNNCLVADNLALIGGGMYAGAANNCVIIGNWAGSGFPDDGTGGGGSAGGTLVNCIVFGNGATSGSNYLGSAFQHSCTAPDPGGTGNITVDPQFVDAGSGNYRLAAGSPCRDAGDNDVVAWTEDLDGNPRIVYGTVDMGAYEFRNITSYEDWAAGITNGLTNATDCAAGDGLPNLLRYAAGCPDPMVPDGLAALQIGVGAFPSLIFNRNPDAADLAWFVESADRMADDAAWRGVATNVGGSWLGATNVEESGPGNPVECAVTDPVALDSNRFLRLRVSRP